MGERLIHRQHQQLARVVYCTAKKKHDPEKLKRHEEYLSALKTVGVEVRLGHFIDDRDDCRGCGRTWDNPKEKESDVNLALALIDDAYRDLYDDAYLVTADSDQGATAKLFKQRFPEKTLISVVPPGMAASKSIMTHAAGKTTITKDHLEDCLLPGLQVDTVDGKPILRFRRPEVYAPPPGWIPPNQRPR